jgi:hypothetical protein
VADGAALVEGTGDGVTVAAGALTVPVGAALADSLTGLLTGLVGSPPPHPHTETATAVPQAATAMRSRQAVTTGITITARLSQTP